MRDPESTPPQSLLSAAEILAEADRRYHSKDYRESLPMYEKAAQVARQEFNRSTEAEATAQIARNYISLGKIEEGRPYLDAAAKISPSSDPHAYSRFLSVRGRFEWKDQKREEASQTFRDMLEYCQEQQLFGRASDAANMLGILSVDFEEQIKWFSAGVRLLEHTDDHRLMGPLLNNLAATYYDAEKYESALGYYLQARDMHWRYGSEREKLFADLYVGMSYRAAGRSTDANRWLRPILAWSERLGESALIAQVSEELGLVALMENEIDHAREYLQLAVTHYDKAGFREHSPNLIEDLEKRLAKLNKKV
jgi:tetratricopeptide (TPR) repeat protein